MLRRRSRPVICGTPSLTRTWRLSENRIVSRYCTLHFKKLTVDFVQGEVWHSSHVGEEAICSGCVDRNNVSYIGLRHCSGRKNSDYRYLVVGIFWQSVVVRTRQGTRFWSPGSSEPMVFGAGFCVWKYTYLILPCVADLCAPPNSEEEEACRAAASDRSGYSSVFFLSKTGTCSIEDAVIGDLAVYSTILPYLPHPYQLWAEINGSVCVRGELCSGHKACNKFK